MLETAKVREIFDHAIELSSEVERQAYLDTACANNPELRAQVVDLLKAHTDAGSFLDKPIEAVNASSGARTEAFDKDSSERATPVSTDMTEPRGDAETNLSFLAPATKPGSLGRLGHYEVQQVIGSGGFGVVLKAFDESLHRIVAIKVLLQAYAASGAAKKRFIREARAAAAVKNEHVVSIYQVQEKDDPPYLVMECIDGISLQDKLDKVGTLNVKEVLRIGMQIAEGLAAAAKQGLVHRDIKPANILLENGVERVKITDFGLARAVDDATMTQSGTVAGTPTYMSPEQAEGLPVDHRSDLFSLGTVMYAMCAGHSPFRASGTHAVLKRVIDAAPRPIREVNNEVPEWLSDIIGKLHAKKPDDRYQTAKEVAELLGQRLADLQAGRPIEAQRAPAANPPADAGGSLRRRVAGVAAFVAFAALAWWLHPQLLLTITNSSRLWITGKDVVALQWVLTRDGEVVKEFKGLGFQCFEVEPGDYVLKPTNLKPGDLIHFTIGKRALLSGGATWNESDHLSFTAGRGERITIDAALIRGTTPDASGWVQLFNGRDLRGWSSLMAPFEVKDGILTGRHGVLIHERGFENFHLRVEARFPAGDEGTSVFFRCQPGVRFVTTGYTADIEMTDQKEWTAKLCRGVRVDDLHREKLAFQPGEWFVMEVIALGKHITVKINDKVVADVTDGTHTQGHIALHGRASTVEYKSIKIKELPKTPVAAPSWTPLLDLSAWNVPNDGAWKTEFPLLVGRGGAQGSRLVTKRTDFRDFDLSADVEFEAVGPVDGEPSVTFFPRWQKDSGFGFAYQGHIKRFTQYAHGDEAPLTDVDVVVPTQLERPQKTWHRLFIQARGPTIWFDVDDARIGRARGKMTQGAIALHVAPGWIVRFRKIEVKELPSVEPGWTPLVYGNLHSWKIFGDVKLDGPDLHLRTGGSVDTIDKLPRNFHLRTEVKLLKGAGLIHFHAKPRVEAKLQQGLEGWLLSLTENADGKVNGELLATNRAEPDDVNNFPAVDLAKVGEWFRLEIVAKDNMTEVFVEGRRVMHLLHADNVPTAGILRLMNTSPNARDGHLVFRKLEVKELTSQPPSAPGWVVVDPHKDSKVEHVGDRVGFTLPGKFRYMLSTEYDRTTTAPRLMRSLEGDFDLHAKVAGLPALPGKPSSGGGAGSISGGLLVWHDDENFVQMFHQRLGGATATKGVVYMTGALGGQHIKLFPAFKPQQIPDASTPLHLRIERRGPLVKGYLSTDGTKWTVVGEVTTKFGAKLDVGVFASINQTTGAQIEFTELSLKRIGGAPSTLPETPAEFLPALVGAWKGEFTQKIADGKPAQKKLDCNIAIDWVAHGRFLRQRVQHGATGDLQLMTLDPKTDVFRSWFFNAHGMSLGPSVGRWDKGAHSVTWTNLPEAGMVGVKTVRFLDVDTVTWDVVFRDKAGATMYEGTGIMKRAPEPVAIDEEISPGPMPPEMAVLHRLVGQWKTTGTLKSPENPNGFKFTTQIRAHKVMGGRFVTGDETGLPGHDDAFWLTTYDAQLKAYRFWLFNAAGQVMDLGGGWDDKTMKMKWNSAALDGSQSTGTWRFVDLSRRDWTTTIKDALGKTILDIEAKSIRESDFTWTSLFNAKNLDGWNIQNKKDGQWKVDLGVLKGTAKGKPYQLFSTIESTNFHLRTKAQVSPGGTGTVFVRINDPNGWKGVGVKLRHLTARDLEVSLFSTLNPTLMMQTKRCELRADQWFDLEISAVGPRIEVKIDGVRKIVHQFTQEHFARHDASGGIVFEVEGPTSVFSLSKIELMELPR